MKKKICVMIRHHAEPNINIFMTRCLPFDSDLRQFSHPFMKPLHCLWGKSDNRTWRENFNMTCLVLFLFWFRSFVYCLTFEERRDREIKSLKLVRPRSRECKNFGRRRTSGGEGSWILDHFHGHHISSLKYLPYCK